ncbi:hypothetical protein FACS189459_4960 [Bacilli bacterium]|nr:hypothetical protein FACS189459_4960 [Bacilli bacterium]
MNKLLLGCFAGMHKPNYLIDTIKDANKYDCRTFMFFTRSPMSFTIPPLKDLKIDEFKKLCVENNFNINNLVVHAPYVMNVGTDDIKK